MTTSLARSASARLSEARRVRWRRTHRKRVKVIREYDGLLFVKLEPSQVAAIEEIARDSAADVDADSTQIEVRYTGRDNDGSVLRLLKAIASLIRDAGGEVECAVTDESGERWFEFYQVKAGRVIVERGTIVRSPPKVLGEGG